MSRKSNVIHVDNVPLDTNDPKHRQWLENHCVAKMGLHTAEPDDAPVKDPDEWQIQLHQHSIDELRAKIRRLEHKVELLGLRQEIRKARRERLESQGSAQMRYSANQRMSQAWANLWGAKSAFEERERKIKGQ